MNNYRRFERQRRDSLARSAQLLASLPNIRALMTTHDSATIQDGSAEVWRMSGTDLLLMADRSGNVLAMRTRTTGFLARRRANAIASRSTAPKNEAGGLAAGICSKLGTTYLFRRAWRWSTLGFLVIGHEIQDRAAQEFGNIVDRRHRVFRRRRPCRDRH